MKKPVLTEEPFSFQSVFDETNSAPQPPLAPYQAAHLQTDPATENNHFSDKILTAVKWIFLYLPGAAAIHFIMIGFALLFIYKDWGGEMLLGTTGIFAAATFMIMLGIGKLKDLKYLKVVGAISLVSLLMAISYAVLASFVAGDFFGIFARTTLPLTALAGYLVKIKIDSESEEN